MMQSSVMFGFIYSMVLIHEKEISVSKVYGILPISQSKLIYLRLIVPLIFATTVTYVLFLWQPFIFSSHASFLGLALLCGIFAPLLAMLISVLSSNRMEGMTWFKLVNLIMVLPLIVYFIPDLGNWLGFIPTHWAYQMLAGMAVDGSSLWSFLMGLIYALLLLIWLVKRFTSTHFL